MRCELFAVLEQFLKSLNSTLITVQNKY